MKRILETVKIIALAAKYSFTFCWKHSKLDTVGRLSIAVATTLLTFLTITVLGQVINAVQTSAGKPHPEYQTLTSFIQSSAAGPIIFFMSLIILGSMIGRFNWFFRSRWNLHLRYANEQQFNDHRASFDVARFRSKEYDDLSKRIGELPFSWQTRIWFSDEMLSLFTTSVSFLLFGATLVSTKIEYAIILAVSAIPMMIVEFKFVAKWWNMFEVLVPHHKKRKMLEKSYQNVNSFVQALMFRQMPKLRTEIEINVNEIEHEYDLIRKENVRVESVTHLFMGVALCGVILHAIWQISVFGGSIGALTVLIAAARTFQSNLENIILQFSQQWNSAKGVILIEKDFLGLMPVIKTENPIKPEFEKAPLIQFEKVSFAYPDTDTLVLKYVSFTIKPGSKVAIVGKSGNGKSSIASLMMRHYDPTSGAIYADGIHLQNIEPDEWNKYASALTQEYTVLERTIAEEISSSRPELPMDLEDVTASSRFAQFDEVIDSDPKGYDSQIGIEFGGREFSGGERQRLALARVHYRRTQILILDEPDAKLDPESAQKVIDNFFALKGVTVIIITHHVSRAERCDQIIMMGKGEVAEVGSHAELMSQDGVYAKMFRKDKERLGHVS